MMDGLDEVFLVYFEVGRDSARLREDGFAGGFVTCFVPGGDLRGAIDAGEAALIEDGYDVVKVDKALLYEPEEWQHDEDVRGTVTECRRTQEIHYGPFTVWGH